MPGKDAILSGPAAGVAGAVRSAARPDKTASDALWAVRRWRSHVPLPPAADTHRDLVTPTGGKGLRPRGVDPMFVHT